jgi:hypothetical protein
VLDERRRTVRRTFFAPNHLELMRRMGTPRHYGYNPLAPPSHRSMMDVGFSEETRIVAWGWWRTTDLDPEGQSGPRKKTRTERAHDDVRGYLGVKDIADDLGMSLANASDALRRTIEKQLMCRDEKGRIYPNGNAPEPALTKAADDAESEDDVFCTENLPEPLRLSFQSLDIKRRAQYVRHYLGMPKSHFEHFEKFDAERRSAHTWRYLQALEYKEQLEADVMAAGRAKGDEPVEAALADAGYQDQEHRGRKKVSRELMIELKVLVEPETFFVQKTNGNFVQNGNSNSYKTENGSGQKSASLLSSSEYSQSSQTPVSKSPRGELQHAIKDALGFQLPLTGPTHH